MYIRSPSQKRRGPALRGAVEKGQPHGNEGDEDQSMARRARLWLWRAWQARGRCHVVAGARNRGYRVRTTIDTGRTYPTKVRPELSRLVGMHLSDFQALVPYTTTKSFIRVLLNPNLTRRLPPSKHCRIHGSRASLLRLNTTSAVCARTLIHAHAGTACACRGSRKAMARTTTKRTSWHSALTLKTRVGVEVGRLRGTRRRNQTQRDENTYRLHRRMIVRPAGGLGGLVARAPKQQRRSVSNDIFPNVATTQNRGIYGR